MFYIRKLKNYLNQLKKIEKFENEFQKNQLLLGRILSNMIIPFPPNTFSQ